MTVRTDRNEAGAVARVGGILGLLLAILGAAPGTVPSVNAQAVVPVGAEFQVNTYTPSAQNAYGVDADEDGDFTIVWESVGQDGDLRGIFGQRFASSGARLGTEFQVNEYTTGEQALPRVGVAATAKSFAVVWSDSVALSMSPHDGSSRGVFGRAYSSSGLPLGSEFQVTTYTQFERDLSRRRDTIEWRFPRGLEQPRARDRARR
jgi:hypothetical protein